ncbi:MAG: hypothetical protein ACRYGK_09245 [Janthinobacterium lividum]
MRLSTPSDLPLRKLELPFTQAGSEGLGDLGELFAAPRKTANVSPSLPPTSIGAGRYTSALPVAGMPATLSQTPTPPGRLPPAFAGSATIGSPSRLQNMNGVATQTVQQRATQALDQDSSAGQPPPRRLRRMAGHADLAAFGASQALPVLTPQRSYVQPAASTWPRAVAQNVSGRELPPTLPGFAQSLPQPSWTQVQQVDFPGPPPPPKTPPFARPQQPSFPTSASQQADLGVPTVPPKTPLREPSPLTLPLPLAATPQLPPGPPPLPPTTPPLEPSAFPLPPSSAATPQLPPGPPPLPPKTPPLEPSAFSLPPSSAATPQLPPGPPALPPKTPHFALSEPVPLPSPPKTPPFPEPDLAPAQTAAAKSRTAPQPAGNPELATGLTASGEVVPSTLPQLISYPKPQPLVPRRLREPETEAAPPESFKSSITRFRPEVTRDPNVPDTSSTAFLVAQKRERERNMPALAKEANRNLLSTAITIAEEQSRTSAADESHVAVVDGKSVAEEPLAAIGQAAVLNKDGEVEVAHLRTFALGLLNFVERRKDENLENRRQHKDELVAELRKISEFRPAGPLCTGEEMLHLRDMYDSAASCGRRLAGQILGVTVHKAIKSNSASFYSCLAACLFELKRIHLTHAAPKVVESYVKLEKANREIHSPGIALMTGTIHEHQANISIGYDNGMASIQGTATHTETLWFDDDRDLNFWNAYGLSVRAGGSRSWLMNFAISFGFNLGTVYFETENMDQMLKLLVNYRANTSMKNSASPASREGWNRTGKIINSVAQNVGGMAMMETEGAPDYLSDKKLVKGVDTAKLKMMVDTLASIIETGSGNGDNVGDADMIKALFAGAYPRVQKRLHRGEAGKEGQPRLIKSEDGQGEKVARQDFKDALARTVPPSRPYGVEKFPFRNYFTSATGTLGKKIALAAGINAGFQWTAEGRWDTNQFRLQHVYGSHGSLDPAWHFDMSVTFRAVSKLERLLDSSLTGGPAPNRMFLYREVMSLFTGSGRYEGKMPREMVDYYGAQADIPQQFLTSLAITDPKEISARLKIAGKHCQKLEELYLDFVEHAPVVAVQPDRFTPPLAEAEIRRERIKSFEFLDEFVWGKQPGRPKSGYESGVEYALEHPEKFMAQTYDAISLGFGNIAVHIGVLKNQMRTLMAESNDPKLIAAKQAEIWEIDERFTKTKTLLDGVYLPMKMVDAMRSESTLIETAFSQRHNITVTNKVIGGLFFDPLQPFTEKVLHDTGDINIINAVGEIMMIASCRFQHADYQINPNRMGQFLEFRLSLQQGLPLAWDLILKVMMTSLESLKPKLEVGSQEYHIRQQMQGLMWEQTAGTMLVVRFRRFPNRANPKFDLQYVRMLQVNVGGPKVQAVIPVPGGVLPTNVNYQLTMQNPTHEWMGKEIGYQMLQSKKLKVLYENAEKVSAAANMTLQEVLYQLLTGAAAKNEPLKSLYTEHQDNRFIASAYFYHKSVIPDFIDQYVEFSDAMEDAERRGIDPATLPWANEFFRFGLSDSEEEPFQRIARLSRLVSLNAPGSTALKEGTVVEVNKDRTIVETRKNPFDTPLSLFEPVKMPEFAEGRTWGMEKEKIMSLANAEERLEYFITGDGFRTFEFLRAILSSFKEIHDNSKHKADPTKAGYETGIEELDD